MKALGSPAGIAIVALLLAAAAHPAFDLTSLGSAGTFALPLLSLLFLLAVGWPRVARVSRVPSWPWACRWRSAPWPTTPSAAAAAG